MRVVGRETGGGSGFFCIKVSIVTCVLSKTL